MGGRPGRPRSQYAEQGLTTGEVADQLGYSRSNIDRLRHKGDLPAKLDRNGTFRFKQATVEDYARRKRRPLKNDETKTFAVYKRFLDPEFKPTPENYARVAVETETPPSRVDELWLQFLRGAPKVQTEVDRLHIVYDEQIAAMNGDREERRRRGIASASREGLAKTRPRVTFIPSPPQPDEEDEAPPSSRVG